MKRNGFQLWNIGKWRTKMLHMLSMGRTFLLLTLGSLIFFVLLGLGGMAEHKMNSSTVSSMKGFAGSLSSRFFMDMLGMELPHLDKEKGGSTFSGEKMTTFVFQMLTSVNPRDPKSLLAKEMPGMGANDPVLLRSAAGNQNLDPPEDFHLPPETDDKGDKPADIDQPKEPDKTPDKTPVKEPEPGGKKEPGNPGTATEGTKEPTKTPTSPNTASGKKVVMIYHSHPREAYNPLLSKTSSNPSSKSSSQNVMLVGEYMAQKLEKLGVGTVHSEKDYSTTVSEYNYNFSYKYSRQTVKEALAQNNGLEYLIDIHRDSQRHAKTTTVINGASYAQVFFIIGHENKNWRKNEAFASSIHEQLEKSYPGISRGIWGKTSAQGNGEYNQSLSDNSILIEVGGIDSTNEELKRTAELLGQIVADLYYKDQKAEKASAEKSVSATKADAKS
ncbi:stage II sporulation protein P [Paenibacillus dokdonensis]|uniref:Stage II sporulation protein P n=1 Tax=Paenibacillus dokdonensis TaxID=2567944 RepID=A0ABU6GVD0_9BACL|nr:stage II sporulation protein P [Paenibacillus dokdonensis]MEC0243072.1 stage II sporulation protein P [Paenibacillus dokdonensis]